jgi:hypothetical protein
VQVWEFAAHPLCLCPLIIAGPGHLLLCCSAAKPFEPELLCKLLPSLLHVLLTGLAVLGCSTVQQL